MPASVGIKIGLNVSKQAQDAFDRLAMAPTLLRLRDQVNEAKKKERHMLRHFSPYVKAAKDPQPVDMRIPWRELDSVLKLLRV